MAGGDEHRAGDDEQGWMAGHLAGEAGEGTRIVAEGTVYNIWTGCGDRATN